MCLKYNGIFKSGYLPRNNQSYSACIAVFHLQEVLQASIKSVHTCAARQYGP